MKNRFKFIFIFSLVICFSQISFAIPNPWTDCKDDISCAAQKAGFNFPLRVNNYSVRAMNDMIEIRFPLNKNKNLIVRKSQLFDGNADANGIKDISGVYTNYPVNKTIRLKNGVPFNVRGNGNKFYVANFAAENGYYSFYCEKGMYMKDINRLYSLLEEAEAPRNNFDEKSIKEIENLQNSGQEDEIPNPVYTQDCFPRTLEKKGVTKNCFDGANFGDDSNCSASEIRMIKEYYKKGQNKDPLNDGSGNFCALSERD